MFTKSLVDGRMLKFSYAPPQTDLDLRKDAKGEPKEQAGLPKAPKRDTNPLYRSVYYYWWEFLRLNDHYLACCEQGGQGQFAELYGDFGDVRDDARPTINNDGDHFKAWWIERGAYLFAEPVDMDRPKVVEDLAVPPSKGTHLLVSVPFSPSLKDTMEDIRALLAPHFAQHQEDTGHFSKALYRVENKHSLSAMEFSLQAKKVQKSFAAAVGRKPTLAQITVFARMEGEHDYENVPTPNDVDGALRNAAAPAIDRADLWIANCVYGKFPDTDETDPASRNTNGMPTAERRALHSRHLGRIAAGQSLID